MLGNVLVGKALGKCKLLRGWLWENSIRCILGRAN
jgi:hypothetical protein